MSGCFVSHFLKGFCSTFYTSLYYYNHQKCVNILGFKAHHINLFISGRMWSALKKNQALLSLIFTENLPSNQGFFLCSGKNAYFSSRNSGFVLFSLKKNNIPVRLFLKLCSFAFSLSYSKPWFPPVSRSKQNGGLGQRGWCRNQRQGGGGFAASGWGSSPCRSTHCHR